MSGHIGLGFIICISAMLIQAEVPALADACDPYIAAMMKFDHTPHRAETVLGEQKGTGHFNVAAKKIFTGDALYELKDGRWKKTDMTGDALGQIFRKSWASYAEACSSEGVAAINGDNAEIVSMHGESSSAGPEPVSSDSRVWISLATGLPLKEEKTFSITNQGGDISSIETTTTYEYDAVQAPDM